MTTKPILRKYIYLRRAIRSLRGLRYYLLDILGYIIFRLFYNSRVVFKRKEIQKILLIRLDRIGDMLLTTPAIRALRESYPLAQIDLLASRYTKDLLYGNQDINNIIEREAFISIGDCGKELKKRGYDAVLVFHPDFSCNRLAYLAGAKWRIGYSGRGGSFYLNRVLKDDRGIRIRHEIDSALEVTAQIEAFTDDKSVKLIISEENIALAREFLKKNKVDGKFAVIHPGSRQPYMRWKKEGFAEVAKWLIETKNMKVVFTCGKDEYDHVMETAYLVKEGVVIAEGLTLGVLAALISQSSLFVGNSTGPMHIAAALSVPTVAIFGNVHPLDSYKAWSPVSPNSKIIFSELNCPGCHPGDCISFDCMAGIDPKKVIASADELLGGQS